jgi:DnaK suppressor protein
MNMIDKQSEMKAILEKMKEEALNEITKAMKSGANSVTGEPSGDIYDQASSERDRELGMLLGDREREKLVSIDEAILRLEEGEYGICEECEEEIPLGRLKVLPFARHCVKCKSDIERQQAQTKRFEEDRVYREIAIGEDEEG